MGTIVVFTLLGLVVAAFVVITGMKAVQARRADQAPLNQQERAEYERLLTMRENIQMQAPEHIALGDSYARIALDEANATYRRRSNEL